MIGQDEMSEQFANKVTQFLLLINWIFLRELTRRSRCMQQKYTYTYIQFLKISIRKNLTNGSSSVRLAIKVKKENSILTTMNVSNEYFS